ncbi:neither inactivation nor afterpotential protein G [Anopheles ziemanni]|uniref:neither inactivation nor afterpotential protein G n=1 Tax=Anopheles coustani TaxID=139045 RepID=UPI0026587C01|nr:neither inactivation nor afterpotential protein G [Anopheles coustani]XP_058173816.1 neither inactivation nor afterpotential protein G [Anopheles ziemanni]
MSCLKKCLVFSLLATVLLSAILLLLWIWLGTETIPNQIRDPHLVEGQAFDYIIVGGGTAGCVLANRLSADPNVTVLLVEAGDNFGAASIIPLISTAMQGTKYDWAFRTTPQKYSSHGLGNNQQLLPRGKGLGGSGQINYMLHFTGVPEDFERWERSGAFDWNWHAMKPYIDQLEQPSMARHHAEPECSGTRENVMECQQDLTGDDLYQTNTYASILNPENDEHASISLCATKNRPNAPHVTRTNGLLVTEVNPQDSLLAKVFTEAPSELGREYLFKPARYTIHNGIRWSSYHAYLRPAFGRPNLTILTSTSVAKVLFDERKRTKGIAIQGIEHLIAVKAHREVILSAGALHTPQILKLSGIGPKLELQRHGIELVHDSSNVGQNYFDHLNLPLFVSIGVKASVTLDKVLSFESIVQYLNHGKGVLANTAIAGIGGPRGGRHGIILFGMGSVDEQALRHVSNMEQDTFRAFFPFYRNSSQEGFLFLSTCHQPRSRGAIFLRDRHIGSEPFFNPNYLKDRSDIECMMAAIRLVARTVRTEAFRKIGAQLHWPRIKRCSNFGPPDNVVQQPSDRYLECILRTSALTGHHPGGTAAIGDGADAVVDNQLRVNGVHGLRVVDASIFPTPVSGTPNSVVIAVAEKGSDLILKGDH